MYINNDKGTGNPHFIVFPNISLFSQTFPRLHYHPFLNLSLKFTRKNIKTIVYIYQVILMIECKRLTG